METQITTQTKPIETRIELAKQELAQAQEKIIRYEKVKEQKKRLNAGFANLMSKTDLEIQHPQNGYQDYNSDKSIFNNYYTRTNNCPAYEILHTIKSKRFYPDANQLLKDKISNEIDRYHRLFWNRTITEQEYNSILEATEPFLGRYIQRFYDERKQEEEKLKKLVAAEEKAYAKTQIKIPQVQSQQETRVETTASVQKRTSLLERLFGGKN